MENNNRVTYTLVTYAGIDYGCGRQNIDQNTGIRYGVISHHAVGAVWYQDAEFPGSVACPQCGEIFSLHDGIEACSECDCSLSEGIEVGYQFLDTDTYRAEQIDENVIVVFKSIYFTHAQFCSPCFPGGGNLEVPLDLPGEHIGNNRAYCFGHEMFENGQAPYPVYRIANNERVFPIQTT